MYNPTVIRLLTIGNCTGMVIENSVGDDIYFQVYQTRPENNKTFLKYSMPWGSQVKALEDFETWVSCEKYCLAKPYKFSYASPSPDWRK